MQIHLRAARFLGINYYLPHDIMERWCARLQGRALQASAYTDGLGVYPGRFARSALIRFRARVCELAAGLSQRATAGPPTIK